MIRLLSIMITLIPILGCEKEGDFVVQNCYGEAIEIAIEFNEDQTELLSEIEQQAMNNQITFSLQYLETKAIIRTTESEIELGSPLKKVVVTRKNIEKIINYGDDIISLMDTDAVGEIKCCPFVLCI